MLEQYDLTEAHQSQGIVRDIDTGSTFSPFWNIRDPPFPVGQTHFPLLPGEEGKNPPTFMTACAVGNKATRINAYYNQGVVRLTSSNHTCSNAVPAERDDDPGVHLQFHVSEGERLTRVWLCYSLISASKCPALIVSIFFRACNQRSNERGTDRDQSRQEVQHRTRDTCWRRAWTQIFLPGRQRAVGTLSATEPSGRRKCKTVLFWCIASC